MNLLVFLLEEQSMQVFLDHYLPRRFPALKYKCISHQGKSDLEKSIPRKLRAWKDPFFVIARDNDGSDCKALKSRLTELCISAGRPDSKIRIVCQSLEAWYLGAPSVVAEEYKCSKLLEVMRKRKNRNPDLIPAPDKFLFRYVPEFRKIDGARRLGQSMPLNLEENSSASFRIFMKTIELIAEKQQ